MSKPDPHLVLVLKYSTDNGLGSWHGRTSVAVCYSNDGPIARTGHEPGAILSPSWTGIQDLYQGYVNLTVTGTLSQDFGGWTGWDLEYRDAYSVDLARASTMAKTLRRIAKAMDTLSQVRGTPPDFATYLARFAEVIGCQRYAERSDTILANGSYWRHWDVDGMRRWVTGREKQFRALYMGNS